MRLLRIDVLENFVNDQYQIVSEIKSYDRRENVFKKLKYNEVKEYYFEE